MQSPSLLPAPAMALKLPLTVSTSASPRSSGSSSRAVGVWSADEHDRFLEALKKFPQGPWKAITEFVGTRSVRQVQTHAQKYQEKVSRRLHGMQTGKAVRLRREHRIDHDVLSLVTLISPHGGEARRKHARRALDGSKARSPVARPAEVPVEVAVVKDEAPKTPTGAQRPTLDKVEPDAAAKGLMMAGADADGASPSSISSSALFDGFQYDVDSDALLDFDMLTEDDLPTLSESLDFFIENFA
jgi:SHAQKYF class myb-like DNA-binding protein